ncbi:hypothetical protein BUZ62_07895 [Staphylococcus pasteuri]|uniref:hypothetical protein n=1 Tax=Staphylococcus pasteuri TaxID=45972 RepID=UPI000D3557DD|nr:hypothetical protein [Staphylococcus pasteuri]PTU86400.1 hypothetical protein BUZ62_07895 [Staphylococcus pasteuri]
MKILGYLLSFILMILVIYDVMRCILVFIENTWHKDFGMETLLHNDYIVNGGVMGAIVLMGVLEIINHAIGEDKF